MAVGAPLANYTGEEVIGTLLKCHLLPVVAEIELCQIIMQMLLATMLIGTIHPVLEDAEIYFNLVRVKPPTTVFTSARVFFSHYFL